ncbi:MAG: DNA damage-inducible protein D, partial [Patescibacteria group bacterium]|nr:DNA damage-inducible protein D [Patescibacteria group bacterium]
KPEIAFAQAYFATQTRKMEVLERRMEEFERIDSRERLKITEKEFQDMVYSRGVDGPGIAYLRNVGDKALFGRTTNEMKRRLGITRGPLADVLPNVTLKAKDLATAMTGENTRKKNLRGTDPIAKEHYNTNASVRKALVDTGIYPEELPAAENIKLIEKRHRQERAALEKRHKEELSAATSQIK